MSAKKNDRKKFILTNNTDSAKISNNSNDIIVTENADNINLQDKIPNPTTEMCRKLGAKYYVENIAEEDEDETIFSLESLRKMFISVKSGESEHEFAANVKIADYSKQQNAANTNNNTESGNENNNILNLLEETEETENKSITNTFTEGVEYTNDDENKENAEFGHNEIFEQTIAGTDDGEVKIPISPESIFEAMLFVGDRDNKPLKPEHAAEKMRNVQPYEIDKAVKSLNRKYDLAGSPYKIIEEAGGYRMVLREEFSDIQEKFYGKIREAKLSQGAIDTLAIIAYKQPITAEEIQILRKQPCATLLTQLVRRGLIQFEIETQNKKKKILYKTTPRFLELFQLDSIDDLPVSEDFDFR
ncbi:MAG: SMC-Scp complex subunit ScpB [Planctomycetaceae bacterium]|jgi:segregation and condensation protein B|nr:SMC-Scp complex subunit ScpB [Planctomycetaceae bacterium]